MAIEKGTYQYEALLARLNLLEMDPSGKESKIAALKKQLGITTEAVTTAEEEAVTEKKAVTISPTINTHPENESVKEGSSVTFSVAASGTAPLSYQWKKDNFAVTGATSASYSIASATAAGAGSYTVTVSNAAGSTTSNAATLTVTKEEKKEEKKVVTEKVVTKQPTVKPELTIKRTPYPKWWNDEGIAKISLTSPGSQMVITARSDYQLYIAAIALTVSGECNISFTFGSAGSSGSMDFGGSDEPRGMVIAMGNSPAPCGSGSFMVTGTSDESVSIGGFVSYFLWKKEA